MKKNYFLATLLCLLGYAVSAQTIVANDDEFLVNGNTGQYIPGARHNDIINGVPGTQAACNTALYTMVSSQSPMITLANDCGGISVAAGIPAGTYTFTYQACLTSAPNVCDTAVVTINICTVSSPVITMASMGCGAPTLPVNVSGLPESGTWTLHYYRNNLGWQQLQGTGPVATLTLQPGDYTFYVENQQSCESSNVNFYVSYPETLIGSLIADYVDADNNGQVSVGDIMLYQASLTNPMDCDITNLHPVGGNLVESGSIQLLAGGETNDTSITGYYEITQADINNGWFSGMMFISGTYADNQPAYTKIFSEFEFNLNDGIRMIAFVDTNGNGVKDNGEENYANGEFTYQMGNNQPTTAYTYGGEYIIYESDPSNTYSLYYSVNNSTCADAYVVNVPSYNNVSVAANSGLTNYYFPLTQNPCTDLQVYMYTNGAVPGMPYHNYIVVYNEGNQAIAPATVNYTAPAGIAITSISEAGAVQSLNGFAYTFSNLAPGDHVFIDVTLAVPPIPGVALGDEVISTVSVTVPAGDTNEENNIFTLNRIITGSFDPNDKAEKHGGEILHSSFSANDYLTYTIRFENTGNGDAHFVKITDDLDSKLNPATLQLLSSSHDYILERSGNHLEWKFNNIQLPPHQENTTIGQGYVMFRVKPMPGYAVGDIIPNTAAIFFDTNPAIITNTVTTEFVTTAGVGDNVAETVVVYPNPASNVLNIVAGSQTVTSIHITDVTGKIVMQHVSSQNSMDISPLAKGVYFVKVLLASGSQQTIKIIKE